MAFSLRDYSHLQEIASGAFSTVYKATQKSLSRNVIIKELKPVKAQNQQDILSFSNEAKITAQLTHENIITLYDYAYFAGSYYLVMEYVHGENFESVLNSDHPLESKLSILKNALKGLKFSHSKGVLHRDLKPENILISNTEQVKLTDFGLATVQKNLSQTNLIGTALYMSPESFVNPLSVDNRSDIFSAGIILYRILTGEYPFKGDSLGEVSYEILNTKPPKPHPKSENLHNLCDTTMGALEKDINNRTVSLNDIIITIEQFLHGTVINQSTIEEPPLSDGTKQTSISLNEDKLPTTALHSNSKTSFPPMFVVILTAVFSVCGYFYYVKGYKKELPKASLPMIKIPQDQIHSSSDSQKITTQLKKGKMITGGPKPLLGTTKTALSKGMVKLRGLLPDHTVLINNKIWKSTNTDSLILDQGVYTVTVQHKETLLFSRQIEVMPFHSINLNIQEESKQYEREQNTP